MSDSLWLHASQHTRPPCLSPTPGVYSNSRPSSQWCHPAISSSVVLFSYCPQSLPASGSFPMSQLFSWGGQNTGVSALASFLPKYSQDWSPSEWTLCSPRDSQESSPTPQFKSINSSVLSFLHRPTLTSTHACYCWANGSLEGINDLSRFAPLVSDSVWLPSNSVYFTVRFGFVPQDFDCEGSDLQHYFTTLNFEYRCWSNSPGPL